MLFEEGVENQRIWHVIKHGHVIGGDSLIKERKMIIIWIK